MPLRINHPFFNESNNQQKSVEQPAKINQITNKNQSNGQSKH